MAHPAPYGISYASNKDDKGVGDGPATGKPYIHDEYKGKKTSKEEPSVDDMLTVQDVFSAEEGVVVVVAQEVSQEATTALVVAQEVSQEATPALLEDQQSAEEQRSFLQPAAARAAAEEALATEHPRKIKTAEGFIRRLNEATGTHSIARLEQDDGDTRKTELSLPQATTDIPEIEYKDEHNEIREERPTVVKEIVATTFSEEEGVATEETQAKETTEEELKGSLNEKRDLPDKEGVASEPVQANGNGTGSKPEKKKKKKKFPYGTTSWQQCRHGAVLISQEHPSAPEGWYNLCHILEDESGRPMPRCKREECMTTRQKARIRKIQEERKASEERLASAEENSHDEADQAAMAFSEEEGVAIAKQYRTKQDENEEVILYLRHEDDGGDLPEQEGVVSQEDQDSEKDSEEAGSQEEDPEEQEEQDSEEAGAQEEDPEGIINPGESVERIQICQKSMEVSGQETNKAKPKEWILDWKFRKGEQEMEVTQGYVCQNIVMNWNNLPYQIYGEGWNIEEGNNDDTFGREKMRQGDEFEIFATAWYVEKEEMDFEAPSEESEGTIRQGDNTFERGQDEAQRPWGHLYASDRELFCIPEGAKVKVVHRHCRWKTESPRIDSVKVEIREIEGDGSREQAIVTMRSWINKCNTREDAGFKCRLGNSASENAAEIRWEDIKGRVTSVDLLFFFERGLYMEADTITTPRRMCDKEGTTLEGCHLSKRVKNMKKKKGQQGQLDLMISEKLLEKVNESLSRSGEGVMKIYREDEGNNNNNNNGTHAEINDTETSDDASNEWNEEDKEEIEEWRTKERLMDRIIKDQSRKAEWCRELDKEMETAHKARLFKTRVKDECPEGKHLTQVEQCEMGDAFMSKGQLSEAAVAIISGVIVRAAIRSRRIDYLTKTIGAIKKTMAEEVQEGKERPSKHRKPKREDQSKRQVDKLWDVMINFLDWKTPEYDGTKRYCDLTDVLQCVKMVQDWQGGHDMVRKREGIIKSDTQLLTRSTEDRKGEQIYRAVDVNDEHIRHFEEQIRHKVSIMKAF